MVKPRWLLGVMAQTIIRNGFPAFENVAVNGRIPVISRSATRDIGRRGRLKWADLHRIREKWQGALVIKGILHADDARMAREHGADGIIVSNHGGRQLDAAISPVLLIPEIKAVCGPMTLMVDGGFRRGTDVLKALALGADFVFLGRPFAFAVAARARPGPARDRVTASGIDADLAMLGHRSVDTLDPSCLRQADVRANSTVNACAEKSPRMISSPPVTTLNDRGVRYERALKVPVYGGHLNTRHPRHVEFRHLVPGVMTWPTTISSCRENPDAARNCSGLSPWIS